MNLKLKISVLLLLFATSAFCQLTIRPQVGINAPEITKDLTSGNWDSSVGYQFGADLQFGGDTYFQLGLNFQTTQLSINNVGEMDVSNINIPVMLGFHLLSDEGILGLRAFFGPNLALNVSESLSDSFSEITTDNIKDASFSGIAGFGADFSALFLDVMYNFGLSSFIEGDNIDANRNIFLINAGIKIKF